MVVVHYTIESYWIYRKDTLDKLDRTGYWKDTQEGILWEVHTGPSGYWKVSLLLYSLLKYVKLVSLRPASESAYEWDTEDFTRKYTFIFTIICQNIKITVWRLPFD